MLLKEKPHILYVDDDSSGLQAMRAVLKRWYRVSTAENAQEALAFLEEEEQVDVVISDQLMPGMDGIAFLSRLRYEKPDVLRILLTGQADMNVAVQAVNQGYIFRFLTKPCPASEVLDAVQQAVAHRSLLSSDKEQLIDLVFRDDLTKLYNRRYFDVIHPQEHDRCAQYQRDYSLVFIDLDGVKAVNTHHSHLAGSRMIEQAGGIIQSLTRSSDFGFRFGGDEFVTILIESGKEGAEIYAQRVCDVIAQTRFEADGVELSITASIGIASFPYDGQSTEQIFRQADDAMYAAKKGGKNRVMVCGKMEAA